MILLTYIFVEAVCIILPVFFQSVFKPLTKLVPDLNQCENLSLFLKEVRVNETFL